jgi:FkbM family methyltransferase
MPKINFNNQVIKYTIRDQVDLSVFNEIFKFREYKQAENIIAEAAAAVLDIGAHAGFFSLYTASFNSQISIYALEPEPNNFSALEENIRSNPKLANIKPVNLGLAFKTGQEVLYLSPDSHNHSVLPEYNGSKNKLVVKTISLKDFCVQENIDHISLLKMDIEGGEYKIIENLSENEYDKIDYIFLEVHDDYKLIENILRPAGFSIQVFPCHFDKHLKFILARNKRKKLN